MDGDAKHKWIKNAIRRASYRWPPRSEAKIKARVSRGIYICAICNKEQKAKDIQLDHVEPVVAVETGFVDWNQFIDRLFVPITGFQVLCKPCHTEKSIKENEKRRKT